MTILSFEIGHFGKFKDKAIELRPGVNVITGEEGSGKSTIAAFIRCMLYGITEEEQEEYFPFDFNGNYGGRLRAAWNQQVYEIRRSFIGEGSLEIVSIPGEEAVSDPEETLALMLGGIDRAAFSRYAMIPKDFFGEPENRLSDEDADENAAKRKYKNAESRLLKERAAYEEKLTGDPESERAKQQELLSENSARLVLAERNAKEARERYKQAKRALDADLLEVQQKNDARQEGYLSNIAAEKQALLEVGEVDEDALRRNSLSGIFFMAGGIIAGIVTWFLYSRFAEHIGELKNLLVVTLTGGIAAGLFITGLVLTFMNAIRKSAAMQQLERRKEQRLKTEMAELNYQRYLDQRELIDDHVPDREEREKEVRALMKEQGELEAEAELQQAEHTRLASVIAGLDEEIAERRRNEKEIRAIDIAIDSFRNLYAGGREHQLLPVSEAATCVFAAFRQEENSSIAVYDDEEIILTRDGIERSVSELSEETSLEVMFAVRMAEALEADPGEALPIILDEVFSRMNSDETLRIFSWLRGLKRQIIVLSKR